MIMIIIMRDLRFPAHDGLGTYRDTTDNLTEKYSVGRGVKGSSDLTERSQ